VVKVLYIEICELCGDNIEIFFLKKRIYQKYNIITGLSTLQSEYKNITNWYFLDIVH
jgi:hypothetical protein